VWKRLISRVPPAEEVATTAAVAACHHYYTRHPRPTELLATYYTKNIHRTPPSSMDDRNMSLGGQSIDWNDPAFSSAEFQDSMVAESPWGGNSALNDFTNLGDYSDSPAFGIRTPSKSGPEIAATAGAQQTPPGLHHMPTDMSSQESSSDSSSRRKRKSVSESPMPDASALDYKMQDRASPASHNYQTTAAYEPNFSRPLLNLAVEQGMSDNGEGMFDFNSTASSPNLPRDFNQQMSLDANMAIRRQPVAPPFIQDSPATINPGSMFAVGPSRDQSPPNNNIMFATASPNAIFSTPSSDSNDFAVNPNWNANVNQNPNWPSDFNSQFASPGLAFTPSPGTNGGTPAGATRAVAPRSGRSPLHIAPISTKSRVETQINVVMTLEKPPPFAEHLHLPLHTIAKSKLLTKEDYDPSKVLELHTMLVCTSAMHNAGMKEKALTRAATQDNTDIQRKAELHRDGDAIKNELKGDDDDDDRPANGGEVKICTNCLQRERKRAGRKKLKKEEEQQHWERYETERVVVFNSNEYLPFKPAEQMQHPRGESGTGAEEPYNPPEGAIAVQAQMRIACYCRHQSEKEGFQVIFTLKDYQGNVVAQQISDSILITDDHKTHPPSLTAMTSELLYHHPQLNQNGLPTSYSMVDLQSHSQPFSSSRSAGNLQALGYNQQPQFNPHSHVHQLPNNGYQSQATSATMTPTSMSRPGSPTSAGQIGPNKKRKSSSFHKRLPSGLQMTPRVDTNQPSSANALSGVTMSSNFSPTGAGFAQNDPSYMTIPNNGVPAQFFGSNPTTPANEQSGFAFGAAHQLDMNRAQTASAYFSHPSSAVPSRSNSPILQHNRNLSGYARQPLQTTTNHIGRNPQFYGGLPTANTIEEPDQQAPTITKITPPQGPLRGGTEVSIFGYNFTHNTQIMFGPTLAPTTFYGEQSILAISPPAPQGRCGAVNVRIVQSPNQQRSPQYATPQGQSQVFTYEDDRSSEMMELALRFLSQQSTGDQHRWVQYTNEVAGQFLATHISPQGAPGYGAG